MVVVGWVSDCPMSQLQLLAGHQPLQKNLQEIPPNVVKDYMSSVAKLLLTPVTGVA